MQLEDYFDFVSPDEIKIRGHRVWIEHVLYEYIHRGLSVEELSQRFDTLTPEILHAVILYYLRNKEVMDRYVADWLEHTRLAREQNEREHADWYERMRRLKATLAKQAAP